MNQQDSRLDSDKVLIEITRTKKQRLIEKDDFINNKEQLLTFLNNGTLKTPDHAIVRFLENRTTFKEGDFAFYDKKVFLEFNKDFTDGEKDGILEILTTPIYDLKDKIPKAKVPDIEIPVPKEEKKDEQIDNKQDENDILRKQIEDICLKTEISFNVGNKKDATNLERIFKEHPQKLFEEIKAFANSKNQKHTAKFKGMPLIFLKKRKEINERQKAFNTEKEPTPEVLSEIKKKEEENLEEKIKENSIKNSSIPKISEIHEGVKILKEKQAEFINTLKKEEINLINGPYKWANLKAEMINLARNGDNLYFLSSKDDTISGKPQLVFQTIKKLSLMTKIEVKKKRKSKEDTAESEEEEEKPNYSYKFIDDRYDKRYEGFEIDRLSFDFWVYRIIQNGKEYYLLSKNYLEPQYYTLKGMNIEMKDNSEVSDTMRLKSISNIFIVQGYEPAIKCLSKEEIIKFSGKMNEKEFMEMLFLRHDNRIYGHIPMFEKFISYILLSGKYEEYPLHLLILGPKGCGKTYFEESISHKFNEEMGIMEAGNSTPKALIPSYKERPASQGYILNCQRIALIDELMKMIKNQSEKGGIESIKNQLGQLNMMLEHKKRTIGSGNNNSLVAQATAKCIIVSNPLEDNNFIADHVGIIDDTTLSRMLIYATTQEHQKHINKRQSHHSEKQFDNNYFLTIYDSLNSFLVNVDIEKVKSIFNHYLPMIPNIKMQSIWNARGLHHSVLLLDGITKLRCLFGDKDSEFKPIDEDYLELEKVTAFMIESWKTNLNIENNKSNNFNSTYQNGQKHS